MAHGLEENMGDSCMLGWEVLRVRAISFNNTVNIIHSIHLTVYLVKIAEGS